MITEVTTAPTAEPVTLDEAKEHLGVSHTADDLMISRLIEAAREEAEQFTRRSIMPQTLTGYLDAFAAEIVLPFPPLVGVTSIQYVDTDGTTQTVDPSLYTVDTPASRVYPAYGQSWPSVRAQKNAVTIVFQTGYVTVPAKIKQAILIFTEIGYGGIDPKEAEHLQRAAENLLWPYRDLRF